LSSDLFQVAAGSALGQLHHRAHRNNQDAHAVRRRDGVLAAVVADGCGSGPHSELGARLGAELFAEGLVRRAGDPVEAIARAELELLQIMDALLDRLGGTRAQQIEERFLFTLVGLLVCGDELTTFALGDGLLAVNGVPTRLGPFENNAPPYLGYALVSDEPRFRVQLHHRLPLAQVESALVATDGAADLADPSPLWRDPRAFANPDWVRRQLTVSNLDDDATAVVLRRGRA
jgi:hypothetical protein